MKSDSNHVVKILILTLAISCFSTAMRVSKEVNLGPTVNEIPNGDFIARFAVNQGSNLHASVRVKLTDSFNKSLNFPLFIYFIDDADWESVIHGGDCSNGSQKAKYQIEQTLRGDGEWSNWQSVEKQDLPETTVVYAVITDCSGQTHQSNPSLPYIEVDLHMLNSGSEFSHEENGIIYLYSILLLVYIYFLGSIAYQIVRAAMDKSTIDAPVMGMMFAVYMELLHIGTQCIHLYIYAYNGSGFYLLDLVSTILQMNAQIIIIGSFIMISFGWQITDTDITANTKLIVLGCFVCVFQTCMTFLTVIDDGAHHKYHDYGGFQGFSLVVMRLMLWSIFVFGVLTHIGKIKKKAKPLLKALSVAGTIYMLAFPALWFF